MYPTYSSIQLISLFISSAYKKKERSKTFRHVAVFRIPVTSIMSAISTPRRWGNRVNNRLDYRVRPFNLFHALRVEATGKWAIHAVRL